MKIVKKKPDRRGLGYALWLLAVIGALLAGIALGQAGILAEWQEAWLQVTQRLPGQNDSGDLPALVVDMPFENYNLILDQRQEALRRGVFLPGEADFVTADVRLGEQVIPVRMRLQGGAARHLGEDDQWNFELITRDAQQIFERPHWQLLDPADNNGLREWAFMAALRQEGLPVGEYQFARLIVNGSDRGIYALQEELGPLFSPEDAARQDPGQPPGIVVAYDVQPLWEAARAFSPDLAAATADPAANLISSDSRFLEAEVRGDRNLVQDETLQAEMDQALAGLRGLQRGELAASEIFDVQQYGRFLALVDLWDAAGSLSPFNIAYVYDPGTKRYEPVGRNGNPLRTPIRIPAEATFQDPGLQAAYAAAAAEFSDPAYLESLRSNLGPQAQRLAGLLGSDAGLDSLWDDLALRQEQLAFSLQPAQPLLAHLDSPSLLQEAIIQVKVANTLNMPVEILGFNMDGATFLEVDPAWVADGEEQIIYEDGKVILQPLETVGPFGLRFVTLNLPVVAIVAQDQELDFLGKLDIEIAARILGLDKIQMIPVRESLPAAGDGFQP